ncbi:MAG TPA: carbohydrate ABC transporter permease [Caldilineaceae bacterium]|nr:carbohydrate ABC transporter permease [Caldilineaceae bacterium]
MSAAARPLNRYRIRRSLGRSLLYLLLIGIALLYFIPFVWLVITSLKPINQVFTDPIRWIPDPIAWENYALALTNPSFQYGRLLTNTLFYAGLSTLGIVLSSALVAYGFAWQDFWGKNTLFGITLATMMLPAVVTLIPTYIIFRTVGWVGTYAPLIVPAFLGSAFNIFLLRQFMLTIPTDLSDAAKVDGAGEFTIFWRIMLPLVKPALMVVAVLHFLYAYNDFQGPLIYLTDYNDYPLVLGLYAFQTRMRVEWHLMMAATMSVTLPLIVLFFVAQRYFIEGITLSGLKG